MIWGYPPFQETTIYENRCGYNEDNEDCHIKTMPFPRRSHLSPADPQWPEAYPADPGSTFGHQPYKHFMAVNGFFSDSVAFCGSLFEGLFIGILAPFI